jgi:hypothetical protein
MKDVKMYMMIRRVADHLLLMKIFCVQWKRRFKGTDDSPFHQFPCIFHKFHVASLFLEIVFMLGAEDAYE